MTEDEAKTKWCPFARVGCDVAPGFSINRTPDGPSQYACCIGSACMAWQSQSEWSEEKDALVVVGGYCSLAGARW